MNTTTLDDQINSVFSTIETITSNTDLSDTPNLVETGAALNALSIRIAARLSDVKSKLRSLAEDDGLTQGTLHLKGEKNGRATVTIARPTVALGKNADVPLLKQVLGDAFDSYFEERVTYKVRSGALDDMGKIASTDRRDLVLKHITIKDATPRVSFHRD